MTGDDAKGQRQLLRHTLATLAYRGGKVVATVPEGFATFKVNETTRTPIQILAHISDLLDWALSIAKGNQQWRDAKTGTWEDEVVRFFAALAACDEYLSSDQELGSSAEKLFQGPVADALTHVGQIALLRRMAGAPVKGENYFRAQISAGRVGRDQPAAQFEFD